MQLLLLLLLLSAQSGTLGKDLQPILDGIGSVNIKTALGEARSIAEALELVGAFAPRTGESNANQKTGNAEQSEKSPFAEIFPFADPEIISAFGGYNGQ